ncbi:porin [Undibacterium jejuense]|uniref:Porin n=1 Tax=Undibacterium jejuense TaxID=1344949 RepID=A0A923KK49_9BURK|nr:porin [Undibacterium jejuense]MBC3861450.1 porin [Undibacterium jejuense]
MKKSFLALALMSAFSGAAFAQSSVTIYGIVDVGVQGLSNGNGKQAKVESGQESGSRLGFKGTEDLGGGLKANFVLEQGIAVDTGASSDNLTFGRRSFVGLSGDFGTVNLGRDKTPTFQLFDNFDPFGSGFINNGGGLKAIYFIGGKSTTATTAANTTGRDSNAVFYYTPATLGGFYAVGEYAAGEQAGDNSAGRSLGATFGYKADGLDIAYNYVKDNAYSAALGVNGIKANTIAVNYDFGVAKPVFIYQKKSDDAGVSTKYMTVGVTAPVDAAGKVVATFTKVTDDTVKAGSAIGSAKQFAVGYQYALSKRTDLYTAYARTNQDAQSAIVNSKAGANINELTAGVRHQF